jgi:hypothetical protein
VALADQKASFIAIKVVLLEIICSMFLRIWNMFLDIGSRRDESICRDPQEILDQWVSHAIDSLFQHIHNPHSDELAWSGK